ncbi:hypothetical protein F5144DRAFT_382835 [Chaetomium tenue]|uniref:Uncharacterized protein n=1 Tax=Chaetomium tenue TaxID=1854479 RepID=A0ACB7NUU6_9PEZI|nr:hypothetical protein F5144DRAFT_382835 [Chaetomium globosum]
MEQLPDSDENIIKTVHRSLQDGQEKLYHETSAKATSRGEDRIIQATESAIKEGSATMEAMSLWIRGNQTEAEADRLCRATVLDRQAFGQKIRESSLRHWCEKGGFRISPILGDFLRRYMIEPVTLDSDSDDDEEHDASDSEESDVSDDGAAQANNHLPTRSNDHRPNHHKRKRTHDGRPNSPESQPQRTRRGYEGPSNTAYDFPSPEATSNPRGTIKGTIQWDEVEGVNFIFPYPAAGPGYYVVQCEGPRYTHVFEENPLQLKGRKSPQPVMVKHFARGWPKPKCHEKEEACTYTTDEIVMKFGYRVVDDEEADVTAEWAERSNERLALNVGKASKRVQANKKQKGPSAPSAPPAPPASSAPPTPPTPPPPPTQPTQAPLPSYGPSSRGGFRQRQVPARSSRSGASASATDFWSAGPSESREFVPVADMDYGELWSAQVHIPGYSRWDEPRRGDDMPLARVESDLNPTHR